MVSSLYASLLAIIFIVLTVRVIKVRKSLKVAIGDAGNPSLQRAIRAHGNLCESAPFAIILLILAEANMANLLILHFCGAVFVIGRIFHAIAIGGEKGNLNFRAAGMIMTFTPIALLIFVNLFFYFNNFFGA